jgi:hypothetical protein
MARLCTVCRHQDREAIDVALALVRASNRRIASQHALSEAAVRRHSADHLPSALARAADERQLMRAEDLLDQVREMREHAVDILATAEASGDLRTALAAIREARACLELLAEVEGRIDRRPQIAILAAPEWRRIRSVLLEALIPFPTARAAIAERLAGMEAA